MQRIIAVALIALLGGGAGRPAAAAETTPAAPTLADAHQYFAALIASNGIAALYQAFRDGEFLGYVNYPVREYGGNLCNSGITLSNGTRIDIDWRLAGKAQPSDGQIGMWRSPNVLYESFHMLALEGGIVARPANNIPKLLLAINDEISRNRLLKATGLLASTCRAKSKFD